MGKESEIAWTDATFNPWWGCTKVSPACTNCYAESFSKRTGHTIWGVNSTRRFFGDKHWNEPLKWNERAKREGRRIKVFSGSMCDVCEDRGDLLTPRMRLKDTIEKTPNLDWLLLTKRPENYRRFFWMDTWPENVWAGTTVESQEYADLRIPELVKVPAKVRFLSMEPLLGPVEISWALPDWPLKSRMTSDFKSGPAVNWVIVGGESGAKRRELDIDWVLDIWEQCRRARVPYFMKQDSAFHSGERGRIPDELWVREFPR